MEALTIPDNSPDEITLTVKLADYMRNREAGMMQMTALYLAARERGYNFDKSTNMQTGDISIKLIKQQ